MKKFTAGFLFSDSDSHTIALHSLHFLKEVCNVRNDCNGTFCENSVTFVTFVTFVTLNIANIQTIQSERMPANIFFIGVSSLSGFHRSGVLCGVAFVQRSRLAAAACGVRALRCGCVACYHGALRALRVVAQLSKFGGVHSFVHIEL